MPVAPSCPRCGAPMLSNSSPEGLCPGCLMGVALGEPSQLVPSQPDTQPLPAEQAREAGAGLLDGLVGQVLDEKYRIERKLGQGGMGAVFLATHLGTQRAVAVKVISPALMANEEFVERFRREAHASGRLRHPNIVNVTDFGFDSVGGRRVAYLVMEYLEGQSLGSLLRERIKTTRQIGIELNLVVDIVEQVALAVDEAHRKGVLHRDLKPDNIWLEPNGRGGYTVKVLDFGLAKLREWPDRTAEPPAGTPVPDGPGPDTPPLASSNGPYAQAGEAETLRLEPVGPPIEAHPQLTRAGTVLGTPIYMSPEQCRGARLDTRSDIYSLGVITYELLVGRPPFLGNAAELLAKHCSKLPAPVSVRRGALSESIDVAVLGALAKQPEERPKTATAFSVALRSGADDRGAPRRQALELYGKHFARFVRLSLLGGSIPLALGLALGWIVEDRFGASALTAISALSIIALCAIFGALMNTAVFVPLVAHLLRSPHAPPKLPAVAATLEKGLLPFLTVLALPSRGLLVALAIALFYFYTEFSGTGFTGSGLTVRALLFTALIVSGFPWVRNEMRLRQLGSAVAILQGFGGRAALTIAADLRERLRMKAGRKGWQLLTLEGTVVTLTGAAGLIFLWASIAKPELYLPPPGWLLTGWGYTDWMELTSICLSIAVSVLLNPVVAIMRALTYLTARELGGESLDEILEQLDAHGAMPRDQARNPYERGRAVMPAESSERTLAWRPVALCALAVVLLVLLFLQIPSFSAGFLAAGLVLIVIAYRNLRR